MVKRSKRDQYQSAREHRSHQQSRSRGPSAATTTSGHTRPLPFHVCALSLNPYVNPVCNRSGVVFDAAAITPHLLKARRDPVTGDAMTTRDLITLAMDRDSQGRWQCPVTEKPFTDRTRVVAVVQNPPGNEANVYSYDAVNELNFKAKNYEDLTSGKKFSRKTDVIELQNPDDPELCRKRDINNFRHVSDRGREEEAGGSGDVRHSVTATRIMEEIKRKRERETDAEQKKKRLIMGGGNPKTTSIGEGKHKIYTTDLLGTSMTSGKASTSLTSTSVDVARTNDIREATAEEILESRFWTMRKLKKKGFVRLTTNLGIIDLEVHADIVPRTAANFLGLVEAGRYDGSIFHRSIRNFMIQGGKPAARGETEDCLWGGTFSDEFDDRLKHAGPGILSMANAGAGTNRRQFFLTFKSCAHLDRKHSVFGRVVKGMDVLRTIEAVPTNSETSRPVKAIRIESAEILGKNPAREAEDAEAVRIEERAKARRRKKEGRKALGRNENTGRDSKVTKTAAVAAASTKKKATSAIVGVGKYLPKGSLHNHIDDLGQDGAKAQVAAHTDVAVASLATNPGLKNPTKQKWDFSAW